MATKAIHIELFTNLWFDAFIWTIKCFLARRRHPKCIFSDKIFGLRNQLKAISHFFKNQNTFKLIRNYLRPNALKWKFTPARSPHWGGLWESSIKSAKFHLIRIRGKAKLTYEELSTVLWYVEAIMNSRLLCTLTNDPYEFKVLTPGYEIWENGLSFYKNLTWMK